MQPPRWYPRPPLRSKPYSLSQRIVHVFVAPERSLQPPDIKAICRFQSADLGQLDAETDFSTRVFALIAVQRILMNPI